MVPPLADEGSRDLPDSVRGALGRRSATPQREREMVRSPIFQDKRSRWWSCTARRRPVPIIPRVAWARAGRLIRRLGVALAAPASKGEGKVEAEERYPGWSLLLLAAALSLPWGL